jgi:Tfp pilus assembly protein PilF
MMVTTPMRAIPGGRLGLLFGLWFALCAGAGAAGASESSERLYSRALVDYHAGHYEQALDLLNRSVAADPSDAFALYYRGVTRARLQDYPNAAADLREALRLNPEIDAANLELGVALSQTGQYEEAVSLLERATHMHGLEANAWLFLGIAQLRLTRLGEADESFVRAAELDPKLSLSSQYYRGIVAYHGRRWKEAQGHFQAVVAARPDTDMGHEAAEFLTQLEQGIERPYRVYGATRFQYDSNVVLESDLDLGITNQDDGSFSLLAGASYAPWSNDRFRLQVGYEFFQSLYFEHTNFDIQNHRPEVQFSGRWQDLRFGLLGRYDYYARGRSDFGNFLQQGTAIPWLVWDQHDFGRSEVYYRFRLRDFLDPDFEERDAYNHAAGLRQFLYLDGPDNYLAVGYQFDREDPEDDKLPAPQDPDRFAYDGNEVNCNFGWLLPFDVRGELGYAYRYERYPENSIAANIANLPQPTCGTSSTPPCTTEGRLDKVHHVVVAFRRPLGEYLYLTASYFGTFNGSNDNEFSYVRHIASVGVEVSF